MVSCVMNSRRHAREISPPNGRLVISLHPPFESERLTPSLQPSNLRTLKRAHVSCLILFIFIGLRTLLHFFALTKNTTTLFSIVSALFAKKHGVGGTPFPALDRSEATITLRTSHRPAPTLSGSRITSHLFGHPHHCGERPLVQQSGKAQGIFTIRGNNSAPPGV
jgi:hypothetical protein